MPKLWSMLSWNLYLWSSEEWPWFNSWCCVRIPPARKSYTDIRVKGALSVPRFSSVTFLSKAWRAATACYRCTCCGMRLVDFATVHCATYSRAFVSLFVFFNVWAIVIGKLSSCASYIINYWFSIGASMPWRPEKCHVSRGSIGRFLEVDDEQHSWWGLNRQRIMDCN